MKRSHNAEVTCYPMNPVCFFVLNTKENGNVGIATQDVTRLSLPCLEDPT